MVVIMTYVDDLIIISGNLASISQKKRYLGSKFEVTDLAELNEFLGIKFERIEEAQGCDFHKRRI